MLRAVHVKKFPLSALQWKTLTSIQLRLFIVNVFLKDKKLSINVSLLVCYYLFNDCLLGKKKKNKHTSTVENCWINKLLIRRATTVDMICFKFAKHSWSGKYLTIQEYPSRNGDRRAQPFAYTHNSPPQHGTSLSYNDLIFIIKPICIAVRQTANNHPINFHHGTLRGLKKWLQL